MSEFAPHYTLQEEAVINIHNDTVYRSLKFGAFRLWGEAFGMKNTSNRLEYRYDSLWLIVTFHDATHLGESNRIEYTEFLDYTIYQQVRVTDFSRNLFEGINILDSSDLYGKSTVRIIDNEGRCAAKLEEIIYGDV